MKYSTSYCRQKYLGIRHKSSCVSASRCANDSCSNRV